MESKEIFEPITIASAFVQEDNMPEPEQDDIRIEYHPSSQKSAVHMSLDDYLDLNPSANQENTDNNSQNHTPWHPFSSRLDFEIADLILDTHMNSKQTDGLLSLIQRCVENPQQFSLHNSEHISNIWKAAKTRTTSVNMSQNLFNIFKLTISH